MKKLSLLIMFWCLFIVKYYVDIGIAIKGNRKFFEYVGPDSYSHCKIDILGLRIIVWNKSMRRLAVHQHLYYIENGVHLS